MIIASAATMHTQAHTKPNRLRIKEIDVAVAIARKALVLKSITMPMTSSPSTARKECRRSYDA
jgi:hypothetical protein